MCRAWGMGMGWLRPSYSRLSLVLGGPHNNQQPANQDPAGAIPARARRQRHRKPPNPRLAHSAVHSASTLRPTPHPSQGIDPASHIAPPLRPFERTATDDLRRFLAGTISRH